MGDYIQMENKKDNQNQELKNTDFVAWRYGQLRKQHQNRKVARCYNMRTRQRPETKH